MKEITIISAIWCPSCLILNKHIKNLKKEYPNINIKKLDYDFDEEEVKKLNVGKILPVIITNKNGEEKSVITNAKQTIKTVFTHAAGLKTLKIKIPKPNKNKTPHTTNIT